MEVCPIFIAVPILLATYRRFPLTPLAYTLIFIHACILMLGGHYTYARVPLGFWMQSVLHFSRNPYDRVGHLAQGFVPAIIAREMLFGAHRSSAAAGCFIYLLHLPGDQRLLRVHRMVVGPPWWHGGDGFPGHAGRRLGHAVGHADGADRVDRGQSAAVAPARAAVDESSSSL